MSDFPSEEVNEVNQLKAEVEMWKRSSKEQADWAINHQQQADYYQNELAKAHELLGRVIHQISERWDTVNLTRYFPTDNLHGQRTLANPSGKEGTDVQK